MPSSRTFGHSVAWVAVLGACAPLSDLDSKAAGEEQGVSGAGSGLAGVGGGGLGPSGDAGLGGSRPSAGTFSGGSPSAAGLGGVGLAGGGSAGDGGGLAGEATAGGGAMEPLPDLPLELTEPPVDGDVTATGDAEWEVEGKKLPTFEVHTPSASYWLVKSLSTIVSMSEGANGKQWVAFSSGFRPARGLPSFASFGALPQFETTEDTESRTLRHVRLLSDGTDGAWRLIWDFYPTHVTLTVDKAPVPYGIAYRGVPGDALDAQDLLRLADGSSKSAQSSSVNDFSGAPAWAALSDVSGSHSFFAIQHAADTVADRYQVKDNDSAFLSFGDGMLRASPQRFSFGLVSGTSQAEVRDRVEYIDGQIP